jgi:hypothetical protein
MLLIIKVLRVGALQGGDRIGIIVLSVLAPLFALAPSHLCFLEKTALFGKTFTLTAVFDLIFTDKVYWGLAIDVLVFAEFTDPKIFFFGRVVIVLVFLLVSTLSCSHGIALLRRTARFTSRLSALLVRSREGTILT